MGAMSDENLYFFIELLQNYLLFHLLQSRIVRIPADDRKTNILGQLQEVLARNCLSKQENIWSICYLSDRFVKTTRVNDTKSWFSTLKIKAKKKVKDIYVWPQPWLWFELLCICQYWLHRSISSYLLRCYLHLITCRMFKMGEVCTPPSQISKTFNIK